ncbi:4-hydroxy-2-oxoglutarate aldolase, partial [Tremellales sp. Uapishka_1]
MAVKQVKPGVYAPVLTFFKPGSQDLDIETFKNHVIYMGEAGVGPVVCGSMGEAPMLSEDERMVLIKAAREALDSSGLDLPLIVGTGLSSTRGTIDLCIKSANAGADCVIVIPSGYYASLMDPKALKRFFLDVGEGSPVPVLAYNFPIASGGLDMDSELLEGIAREGNNFCGAKLTCSGIGKITRLVGTTGTSSFQSKFPRRWQQGSAVSPFVVFGGFADFLVPSMYAKAHGAIAGIGNIFPRSFRKLYDLTQEAITTSDASILAEAQKLQALVAQADFYTSKGHIPGAKRFLRDIKGYGGEAREPIQPISETAYSAMMSNPSVIELLAYERELEKIASPSQTVPNGSVEAGSKQSTISPTDGSVVVSRDIPSASDLEDVLQRSTKAFAKHRLDDLSDRIAVAERFLELFGQQKDRLSRDLALQIGRPVAHCAIEVDGTITRGRHMISLARTSLADSLNLDTDTANHRRYIKHVPLGPVLIVSPWNYPWFCQINAVLPALLAGNSILLKPSPQTPLCGEHFAEIYSAAGLPADLLQVLHATPQQVEQIIKDDRVHFVMFTGSVANGHAVIKAASDSFKGVGVELGGKDPAYVRADANLDSAIPALADAVFFNAGQSCCSVERIYVHSEVYDAFVEKFVEKVTKYKLGPPSDPASTMGPVVSSRSAATIRKQIADAVAAGAKALITKSNFDYEEDESTNFVIPQVLVDVDHSMDVMSKETFGPVVGIMKVSSDEEAIRLMNDSPYGLTASVWTDALKSAAIFEELVEQLETGTCYLNNADNLDPALAWSGVKDSGRGVSLSKFGFDAFTQTKSVNIKTL